jgi:hypothetical protein
MGVGAILVSSSTICSWVYRALERRGWHPDRRQRAALSRFLELASISA